MSARHGLACATLPLLLAAACTPSGGPSSSTGTTTAPPPPSAAPSASAALLPAPSAVAPVLPTFLLSSAALAEGQPIPAAHACADDEHLGTSPPLTWTKGPEGTVAYAITMLDPDARGFVHWAVSGILPDVTSLPAGASPKGKMPEGAIEMPNDFGKLGYGGPCPPPGAPHHYIIEITALRKPVISPKADNAFFRALRADGIARSRIIVTHKR
ncbi:MAG: YbhB/YbcL family Raf kinase inhibitor-like protein [Byssovorax sp.]